MNFISLILLPSLIALFLGCFDPPEPPETPDDPDADVEGVRIQEVLFGKTGLSSGTIGETATEFTDVQEVYYQINFEEAVDRRAFVTYWYKDGDLLDSEGWLRIMKGRGFWGKLMNVNSSKSRLDAGEYTIELKLHDYQNNERVDVPITVAHSFTIID